MKLLMFIPLLFSLTACGKYSIRNIDNPTPRPDYGGWLKQDGSPMTDLEGRQALLECGDPSPEMNRFIYERTLGIIESDDRVKHSFMVQGCMEQSGLSRNPAWGRGWTLKESCRLFPRYASYPACQPGAVFPQRSVERRLNSWYCKIKTDREYCRQHAFTPSACDDPKIDYTNPPPECQP